MTVSPLSVSCPLCKAKPRRRCVWTDGRRGGVATMYHLERVRKARNAELYPDATKRRVAREMLRP